MNIPKCKYCGNKWKASCPIRVYGRNEQHSLNHIDVDQDRDYCSHFVSNYLVESPEAIARIIGNFVGLFDCHILIPANSCLSQNRITEEMKQWLADRLKIFMEECI